MHLRDVLVLAVAAAGMLLPPVDALTRLAGQDGEPRTVEIVARRFAFEPALIDAVAGERLRLVVRSADGVHGIEIRRFRVSREIPRGGEPVVIEFTAAEPGTYPIVCSLFCGDGHADMKGALVVAARDRNTE